MEMDCEVLIAASAPAALRILKETDVDLLLADIRMPEMSGMELLAAMQQIADTESNWISRGDDSGTNKKEKSFWAQAGLTPDGEWFIESGQGMGATLQIASEKDAYTLTDRATYLFLTEKLFSVILVEGHETLLNVYHVMTVNPEMWEHVNNAGAKALAAFLISDQTQDMIRDYGVEKFGQPLFFPDADKTEADLGLE